MAHETDCEFAQPLLKNASNVGVERLFLWRKIQECVHGVTIVSNGIGERVPRKLGTGQLR